MKKRRGYFICIIVLSLGVLLIAAVSWARPVTPQISFSKETDLSPAIYTFRFSLWDVPSGGGEETNRIWWEVKNIELLTETLTTNLGSVFDNKKRSGPLRDLDFSEQYWVQVEKLEADGVTYTPVGGRTKLTIVPYAFWSAQSGGVTSLTAGDGLMEDSPVGDVTIWIKPGGVTNPMLAPGSVTFQKIGQVCQDGYYPKFVLPYGWTCSEGTPGLPGPQGLQGPIGDKGDTGAAGADGKTILNGTIAPDPALGVDGDFYIDKVSNTLHGPKTGGAWGPGVLLVGPQGLKGDTGDKGDKGDTGDKGADGKTILNSTVAPDAAIGVDGDFYINTAGNILYGPKTGGAWGTGVSLVGPKGDKGDKGDTGDTGLSGIVRVTNSCTISGGSTPTCTASCTGGKKPLGGGFDISAAQPYLQSAQIAGSNYTVTFRGFLVSVTINVTAICAAY